MDSPPTREQVDSWVQAGHITADQGRRLLGAQAIEATRRARKDPLRLGPAPLWRKTLPALAGMGASIAVAVVLVVADTLVAKKTHLQPGAILAWTPLAFGAAALLVALTQRGTLHEALLACGLTLSFLLPVLHPDPATWMYAIGLAVALACFVLRMDPGTRMALAPAALLVLALCGSGLDGDLAMDDPTGALLAFAALFLVWFSVPQESGWRRLPFLFLLGLWAFAVVGVAVAVVAAVAQNGISIAHPDSGIAGGGAETLVGLAIAVAFPVLLWMLWTQPTTRSFLMPSLPLPRLAVPAKRQQP